MLLPPSLNATAKILLAQRPAHADQAGLWGLPAVKSEQRNPAAGAYHELREELGIDATPGVYIASHQRDVWPTIHLHARRNCLRLTVTDTCAGTSGDGTIIAEGAGTPRPGGYSAIAGVYGFTRRQITDSC